MNPFHYSFKIDEIESTKEFYVSLLGCSEGRSTEHWIDFDFFGNQLSAHVSSDRPALDFCGLVDGVKVPIPHFGCLLSKEQFQVIRQRLEEAGVEFIVKPQTRYEGGAGEQETMFVLDPSGNPLEFKSFKSAGGTFSA